MSADSLVDSREEMPRKTTAGHGEDYANAFLNAGDDFWECVDAIRAMDRIPAGRKQALFDDAFRKVLWKSSFPNFIQYVWQESEIRTQTTVRFLNCTKCNAEIAEDISKCPHCGMSMNTIKRLRKIVECAFCQALIPGYLNKCPACGINMRRIKRRLQKQEAGTVKEVPIGTSVSSKSAGTDASKSREEDDLRARFADAFYDAVRDDDFPQKKKARARFLGDSLAADGKLSARRSRDICGEERTRAAGAPCPSDALPLL